MKMKTISIKLAVVLMLLAAPVFSEPGTTQEPDAAGERTIIRILNLSCSGCFGIIRDRLSSMNGFLDMKASLRNRLVAVDFAPPLTREAVTAAINEIGYQTVVLSGEKIDADPAQTTSGALGCGNSGSCCSGGPGQGPAVALKTGDPSADKDLPSCCQPAAPASLQAAGPQGRQVSGGCCASIETWKQLINAVFRTTPAKSGNQTPETDKSINQRN
ncbi:MAG: hypothetical protein V1793_20325 [Pseudomonadota bacterium]